ncbi:glycosyltransferase family 2 protein [Candidatus Saccharibacteria bacterium]|nr:glycosyltransferase family 2 protein [Candidatus Saccharibacteria bacterium]
MKTRILIIIPAYNESQSIERTIGSILQTHYDYVVINDGSTDNTEQILKQQNYNHINLLNNLGIGGAVQTGYKYALENNYDIAIQFDADGQHNAEYIKDLIQPIIDQEADLVIGSCFVNKNSDNQRASKIRRFGVRFLSGTIKLFSGKRIYDPTSGFRAANRKVIELFTNNYPLEYPEPISNYELLRSRHYKIKEVPVKMNKRTTGRSSIHSWKSVYAAINVFLSIIILSIGRNKYD